VEAPAERATPCVRASTSVIRRLVLGKIDALWVAEPPSHLLHIVKCNLARANCTFENVNFDDTISELVLVPAHAARGSAGVQGLRFNQGRVARWTAHTAFDDPIASRAKASR
jgi:hypothetical protein